VLKEITLMIVVLSVVVPTMTVYGQTTEDDGYTYPDDASDDEKQQIDEQEHDAWEDAGRPGDTSNDNDDDDDGCDNPPSAASCNNGEDTHGVQIPTCKNGIVQDCKVKGGITCIVAERDDPCMDIWYGNTGGGYPKCCDGKDKNSGAQDHTIIKQSTKKVDILKWEKSCYDAGYRNGNGSTSLSSFEKDAWQECGDHGSGADKYYNGFIDGCIKSPAFGERNVCKAYTDTS
jgi:hypothetical protein